MWQPWSLDELTHVMARAPFRWWVAGGHALELHVGRSWRAHADIDVGLCRDDVACATRLLEPLEAHIAAAGELSLYGGQALCAERQQNNVWLRDPRSDHWKLDLLVGDGDAAHWIYRRDPGLRRPWAHAILRSPTGVPYLAPELQLLFKSKAPRTKDHLDAAQVWPYLEPEQRAFLLTALPASHPWREL